MHTFSTIIKNFLYLQYIWVAFFSQSKSNKPWPGPLGMLLPQLPWPSVTGWGGEHLFCKKKPQHNVFIKCIVNHWKSISISFLEGKKLNLHFHSLNFNTPRICGFIKLVLKIKEKQYWNDMLSNYIWGYYIQREVVGLLFLTANVSWGQLFCLTKNCKI